MSVLLDKDGAPVSDGEEVIVNGGLDLSMGRKVKGAFSSLCKRKASYDTSLEDTAPRDSYHLVYICFLMAGVGFLIPWSAIIGAVDYFFYYYLQDFPSVSVVLPMSYLITTFFASTLNLVLVRVVPVHARISFGYVMFLVSLLLIPLLDVGIYNCAIPTTVSFYLTVVSVGLVGLGSGVQQSSIYGLASMLPKKYVQAVMAGESVAAVFEITLRIVTKGTVKSVRVGAFLFFSLSLLIILVCVLCHFFIRRSKMVTYYTRQCRTTGEEVVDHDKGGEDSEVLSASEDNSDEQRLLSNTDCVEMNEVPSQTECEGNGVLKSAQDVVRSDHSSGLATAQEPGRRDKFIKSVKVYLNVVCQIWPLIGAIFIGYFITLLLFPGLISLVQNCTLGTWTPILLIAVFNYTDVVAKYLALIPVKWPPKMLLAGSVSRGVLIPLIILCVSPSPSSPVLGGQVVVWAGLFVLALGLTNGYFGSLPLIEASKHVKEDKDRELAGNIMTWTLLMGLLLGSVVAYALTPLTTIQEHVFCTNSTTTEYFRLCGHENDTILT